MASLQGPGKVTRCGTRWYLAVYGTDFGSPVLDVERVTAVPGFQREIAVLLTVSEVGLAVHVAESNLFEGVV